MLASATFPFLYAPNGRLLDGGALDNTLMKHALGRPCDVTRIFVIAPYPRVLNRGDVPPLRGLSLASHLADMIVDGVPNPRSSGEMRALPLDLSAAGFLSPSPATA